MRWWLGLFVLCLPGRALAHASEQGFVLLLPTDLYVAGGVATVILTLLLIAIVPRRVAEALFRPLPLWRVRRRPRRGWLSLLSLGLLAWAVWRGWTGDQDPTESPLPLLVWTAFWLILVSAQAILGDLWRGLNPWTGLWQLLGRPAPLHYPRALGHWPAVLMLLAFAGYLLADIAPANPERLARAVALYWALNMAGTLAFGPRWLLRAEALSVLMRAYAGLALFGRRGGHVALGLTGWRWSRRAAPPLALALFLVLLLGIGSFDGLNETFFWFGVIGQNPLEFTGRSAVVWQSLVGLLIACAGLIAVFAATLHAGAILAEDARPLSRLVRLYAPTLLPIAFGYHLAHYLPTLLVEAQYLALMLNDPAGQGANLLGLKGMQVTTGFFNTRATVQAIWLTQAGAVVFGHVVAILMAHVVALRLYDSPRRALMSQLPLAIFMVLYTLFGLWLLASPRGA
ncbi:hypothetical protein [Pseudooceanicola sp. LIPI14-2-Ac024]|uniref:hypothetical protein n=1 Tax=Pseudooceanicola sp. LIPI14-2-Ac024 TaxID=3344875 RepID=UPI0035CEF656